MPSDEPEVIICEFCGKPANTAVYCQCLQRQNVKEQPVDCRKSFEDWFAVEAATPLSPHSTGGYKDPVHNCMWNAWEAGWQSRPEREAQEPVKLPKESIAKNVYEAMQWAVRHAENGRHAPDWQEGGNSFAQREARMATERILEILPMRESSNRQGLLDSWQDYPANKPIQFAEDRRVSHPLLFFTESEEGNHIRLGYYDHDDEAFYESGDDKNLSWVHTVTKYFPIPYPKVQRRRG